LSKFGDRQNPWPASENSVGVSNHTWQNHFGKEQVMAFSGFVKIDGIDGESTDSGFAGQIEILSFTHKLSQSGGAATSRHGGETGSRVDVGDYSITKVVDKASPNLLKYCANGKHIPSVVVALTAANDSAHTYMKVTMSDAVISSVQHGGGSNDEGTRPTEEVSFRFSKIEWEYTPFDNKGKAGAAVKSGWDLSTNKAV
jgi:type VI secretion system secreted protein Hcp